MSATDRHWFVIEPDGRGQGRGDVDAVFPWWSFSKTVIALAAYRLAEDGILRLDAILPGKPYTLRQLLRHTAGVPNYGAVAAYHEAVARGDRPWSRAELRHRVPFDALLFPPGSGWAYANIGYLLAREVIETAAGAPLGELARSLIGEPLGLPSMRLAANRTAFSTAKWAAAAGYHPGWVYHGCFIGSARDAASLLHHLFAGRVIESRSLAEMLAGTELGGPVPERPWTRARYGSGLMTGEMGRLGRALGHSGQGPFSVAAVYHFPDTPEARTIACFAEGTNEAVAEHEAARLAALPR